MGEPLALRLPPVRRRDWIKIKNLKRQQVIIGGWKPGLGHRSGTIGSALVGVCDDGGQLRYAGRVDTGFTRAALAGLTARLQPLRPDASPFGILVPAPHACAMPWVEPPWPSRSRSPDGPARALCAARANAAFAPQTLAGRAGRAAFPRIIQAAC